LSNDWTSARTQSNCNVRAILTKALRHVYGCPRAQPLAKDGIHTTFTGALHRYSCHKWSNQSVARGKFLHPPITLSALRSREPGKTPVPRSYMGIVIQLVIHRKRGSFSVRLQDACTMHQTEFGNASAGASIQLMRADLFTAVC
jgi:hypothetical protein